MRKEVESYQRYVDDKIETTLDNLINNNPLGAAMVKLANAYFNNMEEGLRSDLREILSDFVQMVSAATLGYSRLLTAEELSIPVKNAVDKIIELFRNVELV